jgi:hypothetical protein
MQHYEIRFLDRLEVLVVVRAYVAGNDLEALDEAERLCKTHIIEVWQGDRRVARVNKLNAPLMTEAQRSL